MNKNFLYDGHFSIMGVDWDKKSFEHQVYFKVEMKMSNL